VSPWSKQFVSKFEAKLNQLELVKIAAMIVRSHENTAASQAFIDGLLEKKARLGPEATLFLEITKIGIDLRSPVAPAGEGAMADDGAAEVAAVEKKLAVKKALVDKKIEVDALSGLMDT